MSSYNGDDLRYLKVKLYYFIVLIYRISMSLFVL
jgi:hypothetical protein